VISFFDFFYCAMMDSDAKSTAAAPLPSALSPMTGTGQELGLLSRTWYAIVFFNVRARRTEGNEERHRLKNEDVLRLSNTTQPDCQSCVKFADVLRLRLPSSSAARMTAARH